MSYPRGRTKPGNKVLKRVFGPERDEVTGVLRASHEEFQNLYSTVQFLQLWHRALTYTEKMRNA